MKWALFLTASMRFHPSQCFLSVTTITNTRSALITTTTNHLLGLRGGTGGSISSTTFDSSSNQPLTAAAAAATTTSRLYQSVIASESDTTSPASVIMTPAEKLTALRERMKHLNLDVYLVPSGDPHLSEYTPDAYKRREFISGFSGSAGTAVVTQKDALLWTDSRYFNEAALQLDAEHWTLMKSGQPKVDTIPQRLSQLAAQKYQESNEPLRVGLDPFVHAASYPKELRDAFSEAALKDFDNAEIKIGEIDTGHENLIDPIWGEHRPPIPTSPFHVHPLEYAGITYQEKVEKVRKEMETKKATMAVFCSLDDVAYLLNIRSQGDIDTCPVYVFVFCGNLFFGWVVV